MSTLNGWVGVKRAAEMLGSISTGRIRFLANDGRIDTYTIEEQTIVYSVASIKRVAKQLIKDPRSALVRKMGKRTLKQWFAAFS